eukprot:CAMPEP_0176139596 /NCGR_PEP_ID=MMETSP0120_2-20121206/70932_1 /TAXON_ID=160619 /ORGANISM="Kryptoperidinium foliaceum, Strain CCMP 1326" /LENGTH=213 /DNA_ID=CAMNT_0017475597 /DNA_START=224 /DNA_END=862 /DNA_ORIENTATION=+
MANYDDGMIQNAVMTLKLSNRQALMNHILEQESVQENATSYIPIYAKAYTSTLDYEMDLEFYESNALNLEEEGWQRLEIDPFASAVVEMDWTDFCRSSNSTTMHVMLVHDHTNFVEDPPVKFWSSEALEERHRPEFLVEFQEPGSMAPTVTASPTVSWAPSMAPSLSPEPSSTPETLEPSTSAAPTATFCPVCQDMLLQDPNHNITSWPNNDD